MADGLTPIGLPVFDHRYADCVRCPLDYPRRESPTIEVLAEVGRGYQRGGLMFVGAAPGQQETVQRKPFVGPAGRCLDDLLASTGISRDECVISNAVLCRPPGNDLEGQPFVVERCNHRLFEEIREYKPRVVVALGDHAMRALFGRNVHKRLYKEDGCDICDMVGKVRLDKAAWLTIKARAYQKALAGSNIEVPCKPCGGSGMRKYPFEVEQLSTDRKILDMAGSIVDIWNDPQWEHARGFPVETKYVVPTYHPSFLIRERDKKAGGVAGTFFVPYAKHHLRRAKRLLTQDYQYAVDVFQVEEEAQHAGIGSWLAAPMPGDAFYIVDIETEPREAVVEALPHEWIENELALVGGWICKSCGATEEDPRAREVCTAGLESEDEEDSRKKVRVDPLRERITCVGIYRLDKGQCVVLDLRHKPLESPLWRLLAWFLAEPRMRKIFHNGSFDIAVLEATINRIEV